MSSEKCLNLLTDEWLPIKNKSGSIRRVAITRMGSGDIDEIVSPRADFRGAIYQLMIGVLQTSFAPEGRKEWLKYWITPPGNDELQAVLEPFIPAFDLNSKVGTPAFMQDMELIESDKEPIEVLFFGAPGENALNNNTDHFIKRKTIASVDAYWAAIALFLFQTNTAGTGPGFRVTLRGGGPLTTLIRLPDSLEIKSLWHRIWINVLTKDEFEKLHGNYEATMLSDIFPWLEKTRTSEKNQQTLPIDVNPLQMYWPMPERIRLSWKIGETICDISGSRTDIYVDAINKKNKGVNYAGNWVHPLTPFVLSSGKTPNSLKGRAAGEGYRHWVGLILGAGDKKSSTEPAKVVSTYYDSRHDWIESVGVEPNWLPRLWAFGYDLKSAKAKCYYETLMPIFNLKQEQRDDVAEHVQKMIHAASDTLKTLKSALKLAWFKRPKDAKGDMSFIDANFWTSTEQEFYQHLRLIIESLEFEEKISEILKQWSVALKNQTYVLFDQYALSNLNEDGDIKRVIKARHGKGGLEHYLNGSKALKALAA